QHAHADQVGAVDALVEGGNHGAHAEQDGALGGPITRGAGTVFLAGQQHQRRAFSGVVFGRFEDSRHRAVGLGEVAGEAAFGAGCEQVAQADVGKRAADHDLVVAAARAVGVEILLLDAVFSEILPGRRIRGNGTGGTDVIGGYRVTQL